MTGAEATLAVIEALESMAIPYILVGSLSSSYYGIPRSTKDADFVLQTDAASVRRLAEHLGAPFRLDPQMSFETMTMTTRQILVVAEQPFIIEFFLLSEDPHDQERFRRRQRLQLFNREVSLPTAEDVIITKLRWCLQGSRGKDWDDVRNVIAVQGEKIDWGYVHSWCDRHGTRVILDEIRASIPPL
jgi:hypothetical protein